MRACSLRRWASLPTACSRLAVVNPQRAWDAWVCRQGREERGTGTSRLNPLEAQLASELYGGARLRFIAFIRVQGSGKSAWQKRLEVKLASVEAKLASALYGTARLRFMNSASACMRVLIFKVHRLAECCLELPSHAVLQLRQGCSGWLAWRLSVIGHHPSPHVADQCPCHGWVVGEASRVRKRTALGVRADLRVCAAYSCVGWG